MPSVVSINEARDSISVYKNDGTGDFGLPRGDAFGYSSGTSNAPYGAFQVADVNGDGLPDLVNIDVPQYFQQPYQLSVMLNRGNGKFAPPTFSTLPTDAFGFPGDFAVGDFRNTGRPDVIEVGLASELEPSSAFIAYSMNQGNGTFANAVVTTPATATGLIGVGDFNRDGKLDFLTISGDSTGRHSLNVFLGNGDGTFAAQPQMAWGDYDGNTPIQVAVADLNRDGKLDVVVQLYENIVPYTSNDIFAFYGNGDGTFQSPVLLVTNSDPFTMVDLNHDGIPDLVTCAIPGSIYPQVTLAGVTVRLGNGTGGFGSPTSYQMYSGYALIPDVIGSGPGWRGVCLVGDFNNDGNPDIAVPQFDDAYTPAYTQLLSGNGDGTFTPTYNIYSFGRFTVPQQFYDVDSDQHMDLLEMDGLDSSFNYLPGTSAKAFQLETVAEPITGNTGAAQVSLNVPSNSDTVFTLQASDPGLQLPGTVTVPAGSVSQQFTYTVTGQANLHKLFKISAIAGSEQEDAYNFVFTDQRSSPGYTFGLTYTTESVYPGLKSRDYGPGFSTTSNYTTDLTLTCSGLPAGLTCDYWPASVDLGAGDDRLSSMFIVAASGVAPGTYPFQATATDSNSSVSVNASVTVLPPAPNLHVTWPVANGYVDIPLQITYTITNNGDASAHNVTTSTSDTAGQQNITAISTSVGSCTLSSLACSLGTINPGDVITISYTVTPLSVFPSISLQATESEQDAYIDDNTGDAEISAEDYFLTPSLGELTVNRGSQGTLTLTVQPYGSAFRLPITFACTGLPSGATCSFSPSTVTPYGGQPTITVTISVPQIAALAPRIRQASPWLAMWLAPFGVVVTIPSKRNWKKWLVLGLLCLAVLVGLQACGGGGGGNSSGGTGGTGGGGGSTGPQTYNITITANGSGDQHSTPLTLTVQ